MGQSAIPNLHVHEVHAPPHTASTDSQTWRRAGRDREPDAAVSHLAPFKVATREYHRHRVKPMFMPKPLCGPGIRVRDLWDACWRRPFERTWMAEYIDQQLTVNAAWSRVTLGW